VTWASGSVRIWLDARFWRALAFGLSGVALGLAYSLVVVCFFLAAALARTPVGEPALDLWARLCLFVIRFESRRVAGLGGAGSVVATAPGSLFDERRITIQDPAVRKLLGYLLLVFPLSTLEVSSIWLLVRAFAGFLLAIHLWMAPHDPAWPIHTLSEALGVSVLGLVQVWVAPWATVGTVLAHRWLARRLLGQTRDDRLAERVEALTESRARAIDAAATERRRIERDLHDGAQQRLVALALGLGMARRKLDSDPAAAAELITDAHEEAMRALAEIRDLARGIHPAVLTDRGLDAAVSALAARCPVPVEIDVSLPTRLPEPVESTAYFFIAEALTNVARHGRASAVRVSAAVTDGHLGIEVEDDGIGGASRGEGGGLSGLADRLAAQDGRLALQSPPGGPTVVSMRVPCE
jgi:signal transduction histidine kinase